MRAKAILFDKDGTLFDFQRTWAPWTGQIITQLADGDDALNAALTHAWGFDHTTGHLRPDSIVIAGEVWQLAEAVAHLLPALGQDGVLEFLLTTSSDAPGVEVLPLAAYLTALAASGLKLGVATNDSESVARAQLGRLGVVPLFDFIAGYDSGHGGKPAPGMCLAFAQAMKLQPREVVMVGDSIHDLEAGRAAGMQTIAVLTGVADADTLAPFADAVFQDIGHIPNWLKQ